MRLKWGTAPLSVFDLIEISLTLVCIVLAFGRPTLGQRSFSKLEQRLKALSAQRWLCIFILFLFPIAVRSLLLPVYAPPVPYISDEYAYLLQSDTFASGRLTNPSPAVWQSFVSVYVLASPTYTGEYQIGQGVVLALGELLTRVPWTGVMLSMGLMCALIYWALLAWLSPVWAFSGTLVVVDIQLGVLSYWMNSYWGGCVPAIGGALTLGALARLRDAKNAKPVLLSSAIAGGLIILVNSRPLESILLAVVVTATLAFRTFSSHRLSWQVLLTRVIPTLAIGCLASVAFAAYYNYRVTGSSTKFPYLLYRSEYGLPQGFFWQKPIQAKADLPPDIRAEYEDQLRQHERRTSADALLRATGAKLRTFWAFYIGVPLTVCLLFFPLRWRSDTLQSMAVPAASLILVLVLDNLLFFAYFPHYSAAVTALIVLTVIQCIRKMRTYAAPGLFLSRALPLLCVFGLVLPICGRWIEGWLPLSVQKTTMLWDSEFVHEVSRERFVPELEKQPGKQLILVRYEPYSGEKKTEWIFNQANLHDAKIVWARDPQERSVVERLLTEYSGRNLWLAEPDAKPPRILPYPATALP